MIGGQCSVYVEVGKTTTGNDRNELKNFKAIDGGPAPIGATSVAGAGTTAGATAGGTKPPLFV